MQENPVRIGNIAYDIDRRLITGCRIVCPLRVLRVLRGETGAPLAFQPIKIAPPLGTCPLLKLRRLALRRSIRRTVL